MDFGSVVKKTEYNMMLVEYSDQILLLIKGKFQSSRMDIPLPGEIPIPLPGEIPIPLPGEIPPMPMERYNVAMPQVRE